MPESTASLVFSLNDTQIYFHDTHKVLHLKYNGPDCRSIYAEVLKALQQFTLELKAEAWLFDLSLCKTIQTDTTSQNVETLAQALSNSHLKRYARVVSQDKLYEETIQHRIHTLNKIYNLNLEIGHFSSEVEALAWLFEASSGTLMEDNA